MPLELPEQCFDAIAVDLKLYADSACRAFAAGEVLVARAGGDASGLTHTLDDLRTSAELAGQLYEFFRSAASHEELIRSFIAGLSHHVASIESVPAPERDVA